MTAYFVIAEPRLVRRDPEDDCPSTTIGSSSRAPNVLADANDVLGAERHGNLEVVSPGERIFLRLG